MKIIIYKKQSKALKYNMHPLFKDIGTNIGTHALAIASLEREVVAVDAVFYNLALLSHRYVPFL
jgi:hypothetical protein